MQEELARMKQANRASSSGSAYQTPPPKVAAPSPMKNRVTSPGSPGPPPKPPAGVDGNDVPPPPKSEGAKLARLRRLCDLKPSGKCSVPTEVHERWKRGDKQEREAMVEEFEKANWSKELPVDHETIFLDVLALDVGNLCIDYQTGVVQTSL